MCVLSLDVKLFDNVTNEFNKELPIGTKFKLRAESSL